MGLRPLILLMALGFMPLIATSANESLVDVEYAYKTGQYFSAARLAFNEAAQSKGRNQAMAYAWVTESLIKAGLDQSAFYFFSRTLQLQDRTASRKVLEHAPMFVERMGPDLMKTVLSRFTRIEDYSPKAKNAYYLVTAKDKLLKADYAGVVEVVDAMTQSDPLYPLGLQLRASAHVLQKRLEIALKDFMKCADLAQDRLDDADFKNQNNPLAKKWFDLKRQSAKDLSARCTAGQARTLYEMERFEDSDRAYDQISKASFVWPDTLFEHAWATFAKEEYNRTLGKLVSYKSPALNFVFNTEIDVLMAQSYAALCLYEDASKVIESFIKTNAPVAKEVKMFVESNGNDTVSYYRLGRQSLADKLHTTRALHRFLNRFTRSPYFQSLALSEERALAEKVAVQRLDQARPETRTGSTKGFPGFLNLVLDWRIKTIKTLGGVYVKNSVLDYHQVLISDFEKIQYMKIDILSHMKQRLMEPESAASNERGRGNRRPVRRNDQMLWSFNGEFWNDEIGDYVFALESECGKP